ADVEVRAQTERVDRVLRFAGILPRAHVVLDERLVLALGELISRARLRRHEAMRDDRLRVLDRYVVERDPERSHTRARVELLGSRTLQPIATIGIRVRHARARLEISVERDAERGTVVADCMIAVSIPATERMNGSVGEDHAVIAGDPVIALVVGAVLDDA